MVKSKVSFSKYIKTCNVLATTRSEIQHLKIRKYLLRMRIYNFRALKCHLHYLMHPVQLEIKSPARWYFKDDDLILSKQDVNKSVVDIEFGKIKAVVSSRNRLRRKLKLKPKFADQELLQQLPMMNEIVLMDLERLHQKMHAVHDELDDLDFNQMIYKFLLDEWQNDLKTVDEKRWVYSTTKRYQSYRSTKLMELKQEVARRHKSLTSLLR